VSVASWKQTFRVNLASQASKVFLLWHHYIEDEDNMLLRNNYLITQWHCVTHQNKRIVCLNGVNMLKRGTYGSVF